MPFVYTEGPHCSSNWLEQPQNHIIKPSPTALSFYSSAITT